MRTCRYCGKEYDGPNGFRPCGCKGAESTLGQITSDRLVRAARFLRSNGALTLALGCDDAITEIGTIGKLQAIAKFAHSALHIIDDAEVQPDGSAKLEIPATEWLEINELLEAISDDPHEDMHGLASELTQSA